MSPARVSITLTGSALRVSDFPLEPHSTVYGVDTPSGTEVQLSIAMAFARFAIFAFQLIAAFYMITQGVD